MTEQTTPPLDDHIRPIIHYEQTDASQTKFDFPFLTLAARDIHISINGKMLETAEYQVQSLGKVAGATVILETPPPIDAALVIWRQTRPLRDTKFIEGGQIQALTLNQALDRLTLIQQDYALMLENYLKLPSDFNAAPLALPAPQPNRALKWNENADRLTNSLYDPDLVIGAEDRAQASSIAAQASADIAAKYAAIATNSALSGKPCFYGLRRDHSDLLLDTGIGNYDISNYLACAFAIAGIEYSIDQDGHFLATYQE
ncbi:MAG: hypothetical protein AB8B77_03615 [Alphaproteobacteria bacterium]